MINVFIKVIFSLITVYILFHCFSYSMYELKTKNNIFCGLSIMLFTIISVVLSNIVFWIN